MIGWLLLAALAAFAAVILIRAARFAPAAEPPVPAAPVSADRDKIVRDMQDMIRCKTVSNRDEALVDRREFSRFEALLAERFPLLHARAEKYNVGRTGLVFFLKGAAAAAPAVLMAHYDVVPVDESTWTVPAFDGLLRDGCIWGRGTLDTKGTLCGVVEAAEQLLTGGYTPKNDLYLCFSGEEEIDGGTCPDIVSWLEARGVSPAFVLDEGGAVVENVFPGVARECAVVGIAEKGSVNLDFTIDAQGGHASTPPPRSNLGLLAQAIVRIEGHPFRRELTRPVREMFDTLGRYSSFGYRVIFANLWCFSGLLDALCRRRGGELNALMRTTVAVTRAEGSKAYNVLPSRASFGVNMRLLGTDTIDSATAYLHRVIGDARIRSTLVNGMNPSICSDTSGEAWAFLRRMIHTTWPDAIVTPYLMLACSDSRHYCRITDKVYRFSAMRLSRAERGMIHGSDERIPVDTLVTTVAFYLRLMREL
jgi:carboxypeptidase PM20D1